MLEKKDLNKNTWKKKDLNIRILENEDLNKNTWKWRFK